MAIKNLSEVKKKIGYERWITALAGGTLAYCAFRSLNNRRKKSLPGLTMAVGAGMLLNGTITGNSFLRPVLDQSKRKGPLPKSASVEHGKGVKSDGTVLVNRPASELYRFWRNFENAPQFMPNIESVTTLDEQLSHWVAKAPAGTTVEWDAVVHNDIENELIAWRTVAEPDIHHAGSVAFKPSANGNTEVKLVINYEPPGGKIGDALATVLGEDPAQRIQEYLQRFRELMEGDSKVRAVEQFGKSESIFEQFTRKKF